MLKPLRELADLVHFEILAARTFIVAFIVIQLAMTLGLILGFGYFLPHMSDFQALYLTTGAVSQTIVTVALVMLPQKLSQEKSEGKFEFLWTLPISREVYVFAELATVALFSLPGMILALVLGVWHYELSLNVSVAVLAVVPLGILSLAGVGVAVSLLSPYRQLTNALTQLTIFYVLLFAPVLFPKEQLPDLLQRVSVAMPPTYVADGMRGSLTNLPGTDVVHSMLVLAAFAAGSIAVSATIIRRRG